ncbi:MAG TPA: F0F1 ATP synthase subunit A [Bacteroidia bacterium]|nr:F0F1 ATP synthase subunit A [Bacteroidia bacterium]
MLQLINSQCFSRAKAMLATLLFVLITCPAWASGEADSSAGSAEHGAAIEQVHGEAAAGVESHGQAKKKFDAGDMIMKHIGDSHDWHLWGEGHHAVSVPLPVILYNSQRGLTAFMSGNFHHGEMTYKGYKLNGKGKIETVNEMEAIPAGSSTVNEELNASTIDFSITKNVAALFFSIILILWMFISVAKAYSRRKGEAPKGLQSLIEPLVIFVRDDIAKASIGPKYEKFMPYLLTVFFFIWINNLLGLIPILPGGANVTGNIAVTLTLAVLTFIITSFSANKSYWRHVFAMPGVPLGVLVLLTPIELLGVFLRPFVLTIRLFANITAGHIIALSFFSLIFIFGESSAGAGWGVSILSVAFVIFMTVLELLVAFLQAYVFTFLSAIYFGAAVEEHHHDSEGHDAHVEEAAII